MHADVLLNRSPGRPRWTARSNGPDAQVRKRTDVRRLPDDRRAQAPTAFTDHLRDYRRELESAIAFFDKQAPTPPARDRLQAKLDAVVAEQDDRARLANAR